MSNYGEREKAILKTAENVVFNHVEQITANNDLNVQELDILDKLIDIIKDIKETCSMDEPMNGYSRGGGYSYANNNMNGGNNGMGNSNMGGMSYGWGYPHDGMRFDRDYNIRVNYPAYSRDDDKKHLVEELKKVMNGASTEKERNAIMNCINELGW